jgi:uncharacterized protein YbaP (TraB family)
MAKKLPLLLIIILLQPWQAVASITPALFEVSKHDQVSYFFGSVHMGESRYYPLAEAIEKRFNASKTLVLEIDMQDESAVQMEMMQLMLQHGIYLDGSNLQQNLPAPLYRQTIKVAKRLGIANEHIHRMRPWALALLIGQHYYQSIGLDPRWGAEKYFTDRAKQQQIPMLGLESLSDQIDAMLQLDSQGNTMLQQVLDETESSNYSKNMMSAWERGDSKELAAIFHQELSDDHGDQQFIEHLLRRRNQNWFQQLTPLMQKQTLFVVVGAAHLIGPDNLLEMLRRDGYSVTEVSY